MPPPRQLVVTSGSAAAAKRRNRARHALPSFRPSGLGSRKRSTAPAKHTPARMSSSTTSPRPRANASTFPISRRGIRGGAYHRARKRADSRVSFAPPSAAAATACRAQSASTAFSSRGRPTGGSVAAREQFAPGGNRSRGGSASRKVPGFEIRLDRSRCAFFISAKVREREIRTREKNDGIATPKGGLSSAPPALRLDPNPPCRSVPFPRPRKEAREPCPVTYRS